MIKNLKFNIKNTQLAKALGKKKTPASGTKVVSKEEGAKPSSKLLKSSSRKKPPFLVEATPQEGEEALRPKVQLHKKGSTAQKKAVKADEGRSEELEAPSTSTSVSPSFTSGDSAVDPSQEGISTSRGEVPSTPSDSVASEALIAKSVASSQEAGSICDSIETSSADSSLASNRDLSAQATKNRSDVDAASRDLTSQREASSSSTSAPRAFVPPSKAVRSPHGAGSVRPRTPSSDSTNPSSTRGPRSSRPPLIRESFSSQQARLASQKAQGFTRPSSPTASPSIRLGPTGRHINDLKEEVRTSSQTRSSTSTFTPKRSKSSTKEGTTEEPAGQAGASGDARFAFKRKPASQEEPRRKERSTLKPSQKFGKSDLMRSMDDEGRWRKKRIKKSKASYEDTTIRPASLSVRLPVLVKDLAGEMKLKASELISKLFLQGVALTINDYLDDETTVVLLGEEFGCAITIDTSEEEKIAVTSKTILEEIEESDPEQIVRRPPVVAFMGHVDHGKTSLIDRIRSSNRVDGEAGAITQHIAAFNCHTDHGDLTILDTPGHAAFEDMRQRGARITDVIVLVVAGDDGIMPQTDEAIRHAKEMQATIVVAINKSDKETFDVDKVYRQLSERELLPEAWGGQTITVNCSARTGEGIESLLELVALQSEVLELRANGESRARGSVIEAQLHKGLGNVATILIQNGQLRHGDALVFGCSWGRVKTLRNEHGKDKNGIGPGLPAVITGLDTLPSAGEEFIVVPSEREAREIAEARLEQQKELSAAMGRRSMDLLFQQAKEGKKIFNVILRADVQGSLEALRVALVNIKSDKIELKIVHEGIGEVSESDVELASASDATILGFHTQVESHAIDLIKEKKIAVKCFDVIYHAVDEVRELMRQSLDKLPQEQPLGMARIKAVFKSSHTGKIAGCQVEEGKVERGAHARLLRGGEEIWKGKVASLRRESDDAKEVVKGFECGIVLDSFKEIEVDDEIHVFEITYIEQEL